MIINVESDLCLNLVNCIKEGVFMTNKKLDKSRYIENMISNLPTLRAKMGLTQEETAEKIGVSRVTIALIETRKREMTWNTFLSLVHLFSRNKSTEKMLSIFEIYTDELNDYFLE